MKLAKAMRVTEGAVFLVIGLVPGKIRRSAADKVLLLYDASSRHFRPG